MGLLRQRPKIDPTDTSFQAFARLSLANDSDLLLERLMCILPQRPDQHWSFEDAYGVSLWDIYPTCQVAGICEKDSVLLDGAFGATIHWDKFRKVANTRQVRSLKRIVGQLALHTAPYVLTAGVLLFRMALDAKSFVNACNQLQDIDSAIQKYIATPIAHLKHWALFIAAIGILLIAEACFVFISSPWITRILYGGKFCECIYVVPTIFEPTD
jgi:hypothetical protein